MATTSDPRVLTVRQGKTYRVVFIARDATNALVPLTGWGARFQVLKRADATPAILSVDDSTAAVAVEPGGAIGEIHVRLGADQTSLLTRTCVYDAVIYMKSDPTEVQSLSSGPLVVLRVGDE